MQLHGHRGSPLGGWPLDIVGAPSGSGPSDGSFLLRGPLDIVQDPEGAGPSDGSSLTRGSLECSCMDIVQDPEGASPSDGSSMSLHMTHLGHVTPHDPLGACHPT